MGSVSPWKGLRRGRASNPHGWWMSQSRSVAQLVRKRWAVSSLVLAAGFSLTGAGTLTLGVLLPVLSHRWGLSDQAAGFLLFLQFAGSSLGAIFSGARRVRSMGIGYGILVASASALIFAGPRTLFPAFFFFGLGLGMSMTSTSLLYSDRFPADRAEKLERLNFTWSAGAMAAPLLLLPFLRGASLRILYGSYLALFLALLLWVVFRERHELPPEPVVVEPVSSGSGGMTSFVALVLLAVGSVGVETALGGWLSTYSHRASPQGLAYGAFATFVFMLGFVSSRWVFSTSLLARIGRQRLLRIALWAMAGSVLLLIAGRHGLVIDVASFLCGLSIGPLFPLLLAFLLERSPKGWIFAAAGLGAAVFPWITGVLSTQFGSLRYGLIAPLAAAVAMIALGTVGFRSTKASRVAALGSE